MKYSTLIMKHIFLTVAAVLAFCTVSAQSNIFEAGGNVGIGITTPVSKLDVNGAVRVASGSNADPGTGGAYWMAGGSDFTATLAGYNMSFNTGPNSARVMRMYINTAGNVGIGTGAPNALLSLGNTVQHLKLAIFDNGNYQWGFGMSHQQFEQYFTSDDLANHFSWGSMSFDGNHTFTELMRLDGSGNLSIGTTDPKGNKLAVNGSVIANSLTIKVYPWADYVFKKDYRLRTLANVKAYIDKNHHLPEIPSEQEIKDNGLNLGDINRLLLQKAEELTLYLIEQDKQVKKQAGLIKANDTRLLSNAHCIAAQKKINKSLQAQIDRLAKKR